MSTVLGLGLPYRPANSFIVISGKRRVGWVLALIRLVPVQTLCFSRAGRWPFACGCWSGHPLYRTELAVWPLVVLSAMFGRVCRVEVFDFFDSGQLMNVFPDLPQVLIQLLPSNVRYLTPY
jgi:hypothetical protein